MKKFTSSTAYKFLHLPWLFRCTAWVAIGSQLATPYFSYPTFAATSEAVSNQQITAPPAETPANETPQVVVNRTVPKVQPPSDFATFSETPSDEEIFRARVFAEPLVADGTTTPAENKALAAALTAFLKRQSNDEVAALVGFLDQFPSSPWRVSLLTDLGIVYRKTGHFSKALAAWEEAWNVGKNSTTQNAKLMADRAVAELAELNARVGRFERLLPLFDEIKGRQFYGPAAEKIDGAKRGVFMMQNRPEKCFRCGPLALSRIRAAQNLSDPYNSKIADARSTTNGTSLLQVRNLAQDSGMNFQMARRAPGAKVILPAIVHWKVGHYAALVRSENDRFLVQDPTFTDDIWVSQEALDEEASGYFLIPSDSLPDGWRNVEEAEGSKVWGKGQSQDGDHNRTQCTDTKSPDCGCKDCKGMASYAFHTMLVGLNIVDTPLSYSPPRGSAVKFKATYNSREANQPSIFTYSNLGPRWTCDWIDYITDDPNNTSADASGYMPGGGTQVYAAAGGGTFVRHPESHASLVRTSSTSYELDLPDGSKKIYSRTDGATSFPRKVFLTQEIDPAGNTLTYTYDSSLRIVAVTDAINQVTTLTYGLAADSLKITKVTDPFGRYATFDYTQISNMWQLVKITDTIGITSQFTYSGDFIAALATPYGTTSFTNGQSSGPGTYGTDYTRWIEATDPLGQTEHLEFRDEAPGISFSDASVPAGINSFNQFMNYRDCYYWDKKAWHDYPGVYTKAHNYHFLHRPDTVTMSGILESDKMPLESRVWRNYDGQPVGGSGPAFEGTNGSPSKIARLLDDGTTQLYQLSYNSLGKIKQSIDPSGRKMTNNYAANGIDLTQTYQVVAGANQLLASYTYNSAHLPLTAVDASGKTSSFGYNSSGQLIAATNALLETLTLNYNATNYLTNVVRGKLTPVHGNTYSYAPLSTNSFTYDGYGRLRTTTDSEGYTLTFDYDALDRPTKITYPDNTFEQVVYRALDPVLTKDRRGHWAQTSYDALRRVTDVQDSLNRITHFDWCGCGGLAALTDPAGNVTSWLRDIEGRVTAKVYPDLTQISYNYETNSGRLKSVTDAKNQTTLYDYFVDNNLKQVTYSNAVVGTPSASFTYDTNFNRMVTMTDGNGVTTYSYNPITGSPSLGAGRLSSIDGPFTNDAITYFYDELGRVTNRAINSVAQKLTFDTLGRVAILTNALGTFSNTFVGASGRISTNFYPNGQKTIFSYYGNTSDQRLQTIWNQKSGGATLSKFDYTFDADGQIATWTSQADTNTPAVQVIEYDPVDQLLGSTVRSNSVTGTILKQFVYGYDKAANRTREGIYPAGANSSLASASYNNLNQLTNSIGAGAVRIKGHLDELGTVTVAGSNAPVDSRNTNFVGYASVNTGTNIISVVATDYSSNVRSNRYQVIVTNNGTAQILKYDPNGNLTNVTTATYTNNYEWDAADRLVAINGPTNRSEFTYDGLGRRTKIVEKQNGVAVSTNYFVWCGIELCEARTGTGGTVAKRFFDHGEQILGTNYFFTMDHLGSIREMTDSSGTIRVRYDYDPYGRRTKASGTLDADYGFTGHLVHSTSGLHLTLFRAYDSSLGRWLSRDPLHEEGGVNLYGYVGNDPENRSDPIGLISAKDAANFWSDYSAAGYGQGGFWGGAQSFFGNSMGMFINMWHAKEIEEQAALAGTTWDSCRWQSIKHLGGVAGYAAFDYLQFAGLARAGDLSSLDPMRLLGSVSKGARTQAVGLVEREAVAAAKAGAGKRIMEGEIGDPLFPEWAYAKMQYVVKSASGQTAATIHYWKNLITGASFGCKFVP